MFCLWSRTARRVPGQAAASSERERSTAIRTDVGLMSGLGGGVRLRRHLHARSRRALRCRSVVGVLRCRCQRSESSGAVHARATRRTQVGERCGLDATQVEAHATELLLARAYDLPTRSAHVSGRAEDETRGRQRAWMRPWITSPRANSSLGKKSVMELMCACGGRREARSDVRDARGQRRRGGRRNIASRVACGAERRVRSASFLHPNPCLFFVWCVFACVGISRPIHGPNVHLEYIY